MHLIPGEQWAGAEVQAVTLIRHLRTLGADVRAVVFHHGKVEQALEQLGIDVTVIDQRAMTIGTCFERLADRIQSLRPAVVHVHRYRETVLAAAALWRGSGLPLVRTIHGMPEPYRGWKGAVMAVYHGLERVAIRASGATLIAVSQQIGSSLRQAFPHAAVHVVPNGIDQSTVRPTRERAALRREWGIADDAPVIGFVGRLAPVKGPDLFLRAAARLGQEMPSLCAVLVGQGDQRDRLEAWAREEGCHGVRFLGHRDDIADVLNALDVLVMPSYHEGLPMVLLEAMAAGRPVVATSVGGIPEVVDSRSAFLVPPGSVDALIRAVRTVLTDRILAEALTKTAYEAVVRLTAERMAGQVMEIYRTLVKERRMGEPANRRRGEGAKDRGGEGETEGTGERARAASSFRLLTDFPTLSFIPSSRRPLPHSPSLPFGM
jgi:glycosyltransferase involved in cell wall biosynthesis